MDYRITEKKKTKKITAKRIGREATSWLIILPSLLLFSFFIWAPLIQNIFLSFQETGSGYTGTGFNGFDNYKNVFMDPLFKQALSNTLLYTFWSLIIGFFLPLILAVLVSEMVRFKGFFKSAFYIPNIIPGIAAVLMWKVMMDPNSYGFFNVVLSKMGLNTFDWLSNKNASIPLMIMTMTWKGAGATMLIYLASIQTIDPAQYEVARLEGAGFWQRLRYVTIPALMGNIKLLLIMQIISVFQVFYEPYVLTGGGPSNRTISLAMLIYEYSFGAGTTEAGKSAALGVITSSMLLVFTSLYFYLSRDRKEKAR